jgi:hypothetical protein
MAERLYVAGGLWSRGEVVSGRQRVGAVGTEDPLLVGLGLFTNKGLAASSRLVPVDQAL